MDGLLSDFVFSVPPVSKHGTGGAGGEPNHLPTTFCVIYLFQDERPNHMAGARGRWPFPEHGVVQRALFLARDGPTRRHGREGESKRFTNPGAQGPQSLGSFIQHTSWQMRF